MCHYHRRPYRLTAFSSLFSSFLSPSLLSLVLLSLPNATPTPLLPLFPRALALPLPTGLPGTLLSLDGGVIEPGLLGPGLYGGLTGLDGSAISRPSAITRLTAASFSSFSLTVVCLFCVVEVSRSILEVRANRGAVVSVGESFSDRDGMLHNAVAEITRQCSAGLLLPFITRDTRGNGGR